MFEILWSLKYSEDERGPRMFVLHEVTIVCVAQFDYNSYEVICIIQNFYYIVFTSLFLGVFISKSSLAIKI